MTGIKNTDSSTYIYNLGEADKKRLNLLNQIYNPFSKKALLDIGIKTKQYVIDIACGQGELTCWMAQQLSGKGVVIGIDINDAQLDIARKKALKQGLDNIKFINMSILELCHETIRAQFGLMPDLIYCRYLLIHLTYNQVKNSVKALFDLLSSKGVVMHEECTLLDSIDDNNSGYEGFKRYLGLYAELSTKVNINFDIGLELDSLLVEVGYNEVKSQIVKPQFSKSQHEYLYLDLDTIIPILERYNVATEHDIVAIKNQLAYELDLDSNSHITITNYITTGVK